VKLLNREICDSSRIDRLRAAMNSRVAGRVMVLVGLAGAAWLTGVATAHAASSAPEASESEPVITLSPASPSDVDGVTAASEQAALTPANQLESATASILDVPGELLTTQSGSEPDRATEPADASADATARSTTDGGRLFNTARELVAPAGAAVPVVADGQSSPVIGIARHVTDPVMDMADPVIAPLQKTVKPISGGMSALTSPVTSALTRATEPDTAAIDPVSALFTRLGSTSVHSGRFPQVLPLFGGSGATRSGPAITASEGASIAHDDYTASAPAEDSQVVTSEQPAVHSDDASEVFRFHDGAEPHRIPALSHYGIATTTGVSAGNGLSGSSPHDSGTGLAMPIRADRNAQVSRVTPKTAVSGQLPDHVEDPVVSPD
jgi:hypothetical protein